MISEMWTRSEPDIKAESHQIEELFETVHLQRDVKVLKLKRVLWVTNRKPSWVTHQALVRPRFYGLPSILLDSPSCSWMIRVWSNLLSRRRILVLRCQKEISEKGQGKDVVAYTYLCSGLVNKRHLIMYFLFKSNNLAAVPQGSSTIVQRISDLRV